MYHTVQTHYLTMTIIIPVYIFVLIVCDQTFPIQVIGRFKKGKKLGIDSERDCHTAASLIPPAFRGMKAVCCYSYLWYVYSSTEEGIPCGRESFGIGSCFFDLIHHNY